MIVKNRYYRRSRISEAKFRQLVRWFALDFTATSTAELIGLSVRSVNTIYLKIRGRGAYGKTMVFGLLKRQGKVYTEIVADCSKVTLQGIIRGHVDADTVIHLHRWRGWVGGYWL